MGSSKQNDIERRRLQNRLAQRRFRQRQRSHSQQQATTGHTERQEQLEPRRECQTNTDAQHKSVRSIHHSDISPSSNGPPSLPEFFAIAVNSDLLQGDPPFRPAASIDPDKIPPGWCHLGSGGSPMIEGIMGIDFSSGGSEGTGTRAPADPPSTTDARRDSGAAAAGPVPGPETNKKWQSPLHMAAQNGHHRIVCMLLHHTVDCNEGDSEGLTPLMHATINGFEDVARSLLAHGARVGAVDNQHQSALHWAVRHRREALLKLLLEHCDAGEERSVIDAYDPDGRTPLHTAIDAGWEAGVQVLLRAGADVKVKSKAGVS